MMMRMIPEKALSIKEAPEKLQQMMN